MLYDTGSGCSLINYSMYEKFDTDIDKGYQPIVKSSTGEDMGVLGQVTFTFKINDTPFTQSFIVCRHQTCYNRMDIRMDIGFHHRNSNVYIPPSFVNNPNNKNNPKYKPLTIFNLSKVDHPYIGRDTVIAFADVPEFETVEIASQDKIKEHLAKPRNCVPRGTKLCLKFHLILLLFVLQQMYLDIGRFTCKTKTSLVMFDRGLKKYVRNKDMHSQNTMRTLAEQSLSKWM